VTSENPTAGEKSSTVIRGQVECDSEHRNEKSKKKDEGEVFFFLKRET
jgi:hypothetical protein